MEAAIEAERLRKRFRGHDALNGVDLSVPWGTVLGLLGPNGAGKTTTVRILATLIEPDGGRATVAGFDVARQSREVRKRIGLAGQYAAVDELLTGAENLVLLGRLLHLGRHRARTRATELLDLFSLSDAADRPVRTYSGGMRRRLDLATCLITEPPVLFLDEPTTGLDPTSRRVMWTVIRDLVGSGMTVLLTTQYLDEADQLADSIVVIESGQVIAEGTPDELKGKVGTERLEISVREPGTLGTAVEVLARLATGTPSTDEHRRVVTVPLDGGIADVAAAASALHAAGVEVVDFAVRRPTLDDVFFSLTGHPTGDQSSSDDDRPAT